MINPTLNAKDGLIIQHTTHEQCAVHTLDFPKEKM